MTTKKTPAPPLEPHGAISGGWVCILFSMVLLAMSVWLTMPKLSARSWLATPAQVISTSIYQQTGRSHDWCAQIRFSYVVDGKTYQSRKLSSSQVASAGCDRERSVVEALRSAWPPGTTITAYYDPGQPSRAVMVREGLTWFDYFMFGLFLVMFGGGVYSIRLGRAVLRAAGHRNTAAPVPTL